MEKLNLGCGLSLKRGFLNVDMLDLKSEVTRGYRYRRADARDLSFCLTGSVSVIEAENLVEHLHVDEVPSVLFEWNRVLCPGGYLHILTDDFERIAHTFGQVRRLRTLKQMDLFKQVTYFVLDPSFTPSSLGHKSLWTKALAKRFLESEGFEVEQMHNTGYRNWKLFVTAVKSVSKLRARGRKSSRNSL